MLSAVEGDTLLVKLEDGEDLFKSLRKAAQSHGVTSGCVLFGIGQLRDFELGYFDGTKYKRKTYKGAFELVGLHGTVTLRSDPPLHIHAAVSEANYVLLGGHLFKGTVSVTCEVCIQKFTKIEMKRRLDEDNGLKKLTLRLTGDE